MALSNPTLIGGASTASGFGTGSHETASQTIPDDCLLILTVSVMESNGSTDPSDDITAAASLGAITLVPKLAVGNASNWSWGMASWYAVVVGTGGSSTFTFDGGALNMHNYNWSLSYLTGHDTSTPMGAADDTATSAPASNLTLDTAPASTSVIFAATSSQGGPADSATPGSGWTQISDVIGPGGSASLFTMYRPPGSTATSVLLTENGGVPQVGLAFEILEDSGPPAPSSVMTLTPVRSTMRLG